MSIKSIYEGMRRTITKAQSRSDDWENLMTGMGTSRDKRVYSEFGQSNRISRNQQALDEMYHGNGLVRRICDIFADEQTKKWFRLQVQDVDFDDDVSADVMQALQSLKARERVSDAITWSRLFGGALIIVGINDGRRQGEPVDMDGIKSVDWLRTVDAFEATPFARYTSADTDVSEEKIGEVKEYMITRGDGGETVIVHESRTIRFDGVRTSKRKRTENNGWCDSAMESVYETLRDTDSSFRSMANVMHDFSQAVYTIKGMANMLASDEEGLVMKRLLQIDMGRSFARAIPLDEGEKFERQGSNVNGLPELLEKLMLRLSADTGIPITRLFGQSAKGLAATGEGDEKDFMHTVQNMQESKLRPRLEYLIELIMLSSDGPTGGSIPEKWNISFNPLYQKSDLDSATERKLNAETDAICVENGFLAPMEVRTSRWGGAEYGTEITLSDDEFEVGPPDNDDGEKMDSLKVFSKSAKPRGRND